MAVVLKYDSGLSAGENQSIERRYIIGGTSDADAYSQLVASGDCPATLAGASSTLDRSSITIRHIGGNNYEAEAVWGHSSAFADASFSTTGGQQLVTQSLNTTIYGADAPDHLGQIGVTKNGVEGVQITVPIFAWSESHILPNATVTSSYIDDLTNLTGTVNNATWRTVYPAGEVLFNGVSGQRRTADDWALTFSFSRSPNATGLAVGSITGIAKKGWEYLWCRYNDEVDSGTSLLIRKPIGVYVEQVYPTSNFASLGI